MKFWKEEWNSVGDPAESVTVSNTNVEPPYSVINNSSSPVYYKPEEGKASEKCIIPAGKICFAQVGFLQIQGKRNGGWQMYHGMLSL